MRISLKSPHFFFFIGALTLALTGFIYRNETIDIHFHDTYYVIGMSLYYWVFAVFFWALAIIYTLGKNIMISSKLSLIHLILSFITIICIPIITNESINQSHFLNLSSYSRFSRNIGLPIAILFLLAQLVFLFNLVGGIIMRLIK